MKTISIIWVAIVATIGSANVTASSESQAIDELNMELSAADLLEVPTPVAPSYPTIKPGKSDRLIPSYSTAPPQVPHRVEEYLPITLEDNACLDCHDKRKLLGKKWKKGKKVPMPDNHYGSFEKQGGSEDVAGARYTCTQCHTSQADAPPLVENSF